MDAFQQHRFYKTMSLKEKAGLYARLIREPGWELLKQTFRPELRTRITDSDAKESFLYEAIRAQVIQEIFSTPTQVMNQVDRDYAFRHAQALTEPMPPIEAEDVMLSDEDPTFEA